MFSDSNRIASDFDNNIQYLEIKINCEYINNPKG